MDTGDEGKWVADFVRTPLDCRHAMRKTSPSPRFHLLAGLLVLSLGCTPADSQEQLQAKQQANARQELRSMAEKGDAKAQHSLGWIYGAGLGVPKDTIEAIKWSRMAAEQEHPEAQTNLGIIYYAGDGVPKDVAEAIKWFRKAADQGNAKAQANLGEMYEKGEGAAKDSAEAYKWYLVAAAQKDKPAQKNKESLERALTPEQRTEGERRAREWKPTKPSVK